MEHLVAELPVGDDDWAEYTGTELDTKVRELNVAQRQIEAAIVGAVTHAERCGHYRNDGHRSVGSWIMATTNCTRHEATARHRTARLLRTLETVATEFVAGRVGIAQVRELARLAANPRAGDQVEGSETILLDAAQTLEYADFRVVTARWEQLADADGAHREHDMAHEFRDARCHQVGDEFRFETSHGVIQGTSMQQVFEAFCQAEFDRDWEWVTTTYPDDASVVYMPRTHAQRRADAFVAMVLAAAHTNTRDTGTGDSGATDDSNTDDSGASNSGDGSTGTGNRDDSNTGDSNTGDSNTGDSNTGDSNTGDSNTGDSNSGTGSTGTGTGNSGNSGTGSTGSTGTGSGGSIDVTVNLVCDLDQFEQYVNQQVTDTPVDIDPATVRDRRCETTSGAPVDPHQMVAAAFLGRIRLIVVDGAGVIVHAGRTRRLFTGALREAIQAIDPVCGWLGCNLRAQIADIDHLQPRSRGGPTDSVNAKVMCRKHNIFKHTANYHIQRQPDGTLHTTRPDGTTLHPPDAA